MSPFLQIPPADWLIANDLAFAVADACPVSPGHTLVATRRWVSQWFDATLAEQSAVMSLVAEVRRLLDASLSPRPDGYNVGFDVGEAAGQLVDHLHVHVIPRYRGVAEQAGGVRRLLAEHRTVVQPTDISLATGHPDSPLWQHLAPRVAAAAEVDVLAAFVRLSGLDVIEGALFSALSRGAAVRILVSDYLGLSEPRALQRLAGWQSLWLDAQGNSSAINDMAAAAGKLEVRLVLTSELSSSPASFHPKAWHIRDAASACIVVGSSNLSRPALVTGVEWNLLTSTAAAPHATERFQESFLQLWNESRALTEDLIERYAETARRLWPEGPIFDEQPGGVAVIVPRPWQQRALGNLQKLRTSGRTRALAAVATGMGKTWLAAMDLCEFGRQLGRRPRVLVIAHREHILAQAEAAISSLLDLEFGPAETTWYLGCDEAFGGDLVIASIQKLTRPLGLQLLESQRFDYVVLDEVHHAQAPTWRRVLTRLQATFVLGLTATPERTDGVDVATLFDDNVACEASVGDGIEEESLVPFHYIGIADTIEYQQIPWRSGQFDPQELEQAVISSARMERLWTALREHPASRTLVFCCSKRHALFTRDWLRGRGLTAAAVFSGTGGDSLGTALDQLRSGMLDCLCAVDLFNEGLDIPAVDRVVMLRPTSSRVLFLQQLGRGLRTSPGKQRLLVIDFVGNHRAFARRFLQLLTLGNREADWRDVRGVLRGTVPALPHGCLLDVDLAAKDLLRQFLPQGRVAAEDAYREWREEHGRRPAAAEFLRAGHLPRTLGAATDGWLNFVASQGDLTADEQECVQRFGDWFRMLETTSLNKSFKMIVLRVLVDREQLPGGMELRQLCLACRRQLLEHPVLFRDVTGAGAAIDGRSASDDKWCSWWQQWPIDRWVDVQKGHRWFQLVEGRMDFAISVPDHLRAAFARLSDELIEWRLAAYCINRGLEASGNVSVVCEFSADVSFANQKPTLILPTVDQVSGRPLGLTDVVLPDGQIWSFNLTKKTCRVAGPVGSAENELPGLLRTWYGENAGHPGTEMQVRFSCDAGVWRVSPINRKNMAFEGPGATAVKRLPPGTRRSIAAARQYQDYVPVYDLSIAAGAWGPESSPEVVGWMRLPDRKLERGQFVARVFGESMQPRIPDGAWCLFRPCPAGSRENRLLLVQLRTEYSSETGGRYTVKKYHRVSRQAESEQIELDVIDLLPLNSAFKPIRLTAENAGEVVINAEFVEVVG